MVINLEPKVVCADRTDSSALTGSQIEDKIDFRLWKLMSLSGHVWTKDIYSTLAGMWLGTWFFIESYWIYCNRMKRTPKLPPIEKAMVILAWKNCKADVTKNRLCDLKKKKCNMLVFLVFGILGKEFIECSSIYRFLANLKWKSLCNIILGRWMIICFWVYLSLSQLMLKTSRSFIQLCWPNIFINCSFFCIAVF